MSTTPASRRRPLQILVGVILVAIAFIGVLVFGRGSGGGSTQKTRVVGAAVTIKTGTAVKATDLNTIEVDTVPTGALTNPTAAVGQIARQDIAVGTPVLDSELAAPAATTAAKFYFTLPAGEVALNIPAGDISPYVQPGDQIDII